MGRLMDLNFDVGIEHEIDGVHHINIYSRGATWLGRWLSNFQHAPFTHDDHGSFASIESYWYWLKTGMRHDRLRPLYGVAAKNEGERHPVVPCPEFEEHIKASLYLKIMQNPVAIPPLVESNLPFLHYYVYQKRIIRVEGGEFVIEEWERIRQLLKQ